MRQLLMSGPEIPEALGHTVLKHQTRSITYPELHDTQEGSCTHTNPSICNEKIFEEAHDSTRDSDFSGRGFCPNVNFYVS